MSLALVLAAGTQAVGIEAAVENSLLAQTVTADSLLHSVGILADNSDALPFENLVGIGLACN